MILPKYEQSVKSKSVFQRVADRLGIDYNSNVATFSMADMFYIENEITDDEWQEYDSEWEAGRKERELKRDKFAAMWDLELLRLAGWEYVPEIMPKYEDLLAREIDLVEKLNSGRHYSQASVKRLDGIQKEITVYRRKLEQAVQRHERELERQARLNAFETDIDAIDEPALMPIEGLPFEIYENSLVIFGGISQARKSFFTLHVAGSMRGLGGNVVYWMNEGSRTNMAARHKAWNIQYPGNQNAKMWILSDEAVPLRLNDNDSVSQFIERIRKYDPALVVIDALTGSFKGEENSSTDLTPVMENLLHIKDELNAIVLVADNTGKETKKGLRGSQAKFDKADTVIMFETPKTPSGEVRTTARYDKQKNGAQASALKFRWVTHQVEQGGETTSEIVPVLDTAFVWKDVYYEFIRENEPVSFGDIQKKVLNPEGKPAANNTVTKWLNGLIETGQIFKNDDGLYEVVKADQE